MKKSNNSINVPEARQAMEQFKQQAASDLGVPVPYYKTQKSTTYSIQM